MGLGFVLVIDMGSPMSVIGTDQQMFSSVLVVVLARAKATPRSSALAHPKEEQCFSS